ncbi:MAG: hypothetical protein HY927_11900 [Elusimicrobia bacterium]|nr:hypothetical protein [Elusimicrobiota bacterium]
MRRSLAAFLAVLMAAGSSPAQAQVRSAPVRPTPLPAFRIPLVPPESYASLRGSLGAVLPSLPSPPFLPAPPAALRPVPPSEGVGAVVQPWSAEALAGLLARPEPRPAGALGAPRPAESSAASGSLPTAAREEIALLAGALAASEPGELSVPLRAAFDAAAPFPELTGTAPAASPQEAAPGTGLLPSRVSGSVPAKPFLARMEPNPAMAGVSGTFLVDTSAAGRSLPLTLPESVGLAQSVARAMPSGTLDDASVTEIVIVKDLAGVPSVAAAPSGRALRLSSPAGIVDTDPEGGFRRVYLPVSLLREGWALKAPLPQGLFARPPPEAAIPAAALTRGPERPLLPAQASVFVGGLISISAEPPEGFFAASTAAELKREGWALRRAQEADVWVYRVPDARPRSYFDFLFPSHDRPADTPRAGKFKVAVGVGPAHAPQSPGGAEADLLWLGDEQHGALEAFLERLRGGPFTLGELAEHKGVALRLSPSRAFLSGVDQRRALTQDGFDALETDPEVYRRVFSEDYDAYLSTLFTRAGPKAGKSFLLGTSRGCSQGCAICASGGLSKFQFFSGERMMRELEKIAALAKPAPGEPIDIYFVDSNFNLNAKRLVDFADLLDKSPLKGTFRFFVRHNSVNGFLKPDAGGVKRPRADLLDAFRRLGITEVFMGVDAYDDAGTLTLKTHRGTLAKKGADGRPTYTFAELRGLLREMERGGLAAKGFYLTNNPWVSDLDRVDSWYNLLELWLENPHFSIDAREREILRLKPFAGSPITDVAEAKKLPVVADGRFVAKGPLGELDEMMEFSELGRPRARVGARGALAQFRASLARVRRGAESALADADADRAQAARRLIAKLLARDAALLKSLEGEPGALGLRADIARFSRRHRGLAPWSAAEQKAAFAGASRSLIEGLREGARGEAARPPAGYSPRALELEARAPHTLKDVPAYLADNLGEELAAAAAAGTADVLVLVGDGRQAASAALAEGWRLLEAVGKREGYHRVHRALDGKGRPAFVVSRVNGADRVLHVETLLRLAGLPGARLRVSGKTVSWKAEYLKAFREAGPAPDLVFYGFANTAVDAVLLRNRVENRERFATMVANYERRRRPPADGEHDLAGVRFHVLELAGGERVWVFPCLYGDLSRELLEALVEHGARNIVSMGTAGAVRGRKVGDVLVPSEVLRADGRREKLDWLAPLPLPKGGAYERVATPNIETRAWADEAARRGVDLVEVELEHALDLLRGRPDVSLRAALVVSDVLTGPARKDMTEWGLPETRALMPTLRKVLDAALGAQGDAFWRLRAYRTVPLVSGSGD